MRLWRRVVITGLGVVTSLGTTVEELWNNIINGKSGISRITKFDVTEYPSQIASVVKDFSPEEYIPAKEAKGLLSLPNMQFLLPTRPWRILVLKLMKRMRKRLVY